MNPTRMLDDRDLSARTLVAAAIAVFALWSLRKGNRLRAVLAGIAAAGVAYNGSTEVDDVPESFTRKTEPTDDTVKLRCAICNDPIVPGQPRRPNENDDTVHETCLQATS